MGGRHIVLARPGVADREWPGTKGDRQVQGEERETSEICGE